MMQVDLLVLNGTVVTMDKDHRILQDGGLAVAGGRIVAVGSSRDLIRMYSAADRVDASGKLIIPGLINGHTHIPMTLFRGLADDLDLQDWLTKYIFPAEARNVSEEFVRAGTRLGLAEMIRGGTTTYCDMYYFEDAIADETGAPIVTHISETKREVDDSLKAKGASPVDYLTRIGFLSDRVIAAHMVWPSAGEIDILKRVGVGVVHNPQSNMKLASGVAPVPKMMADGVRVGLGTDGAASNNDLSMWEEMDTAAKLHKVFSGDPKVMSAEEAFELATIRGAQALHLEKEIGSIEKGKRADLVLVNRDSLNQIPLYNVYSDLVYATKASDVATVIINGKIVMRDRRLLTLDEPVIKEGARIFRDQVIKSLSSLGARPKIN